MSNLLKKAWFWVALAATALLAWVLVPRRFLPSPPSWGSGLLESLRDNFWTAVLIVILLVGTIFLIALLARTIRAFLGPVASAETAPGSEGGRFPDIDAAWEEIALRLSQAQINLGTQQVYLLLAPHEDWAAALVHSAGLQLYTEAPAAAAPIHAYATAEGVLLSAAGASAFQSQGPEGVARMEYLCRLLLARQPDCPVVRGVAVLFPISWLADPESIKLAAAVRDDLQTIRRVLKIRCPVFALVTQMEDVAGFNEFIGRMPDAVRHSRCGFAVPSSQTFSGDLVNRGLIWMSGWFHSWIGSLISTDIFNQRGNNLLFCLDHEIRRFRKRLRSVLESAFSTHAESEPILFRGCYFMATGTGSKDEQAFSAGLFRGPRSRVLADHTATEWTVEAEADDRRYRRIAFGVGLGGGLLTLLVWFYIVGQNPWWWIGFLAVAIVWIIATIRLILR